jgi:hypothetical protein
MNNVLLFQGAEEDKPTDLFTSEGLKPSMDDLDNLFEDSSDETEAVGKFSAKIRSSLVRC